VSRKSGAHGVLLRGRGCWLAAAIVVVAGVGVVPAAAATGGGRVQATGTISTVAGGVGGPANATSIGLTPCGVASAGVSVYVADNKLPSGGAGSAVRKVDSAGQLTTPAGTGAAGPLGDGGPAAKAGLTGACGIVVGRSGNLVIADGNGYRVRLVAAATGTFYGQPMTAGHIYTVAGNGLPGFNGDGGPATTAELNNPSGVAVDGAGNLVIADAFNNRVRVVAAATGSFYGQAMTAGHIYTIAGDGTFGFSGDGGPATSAELNAPGAVTMDSAGNLVIADSNNFRVRVVAAATGTFYGQAMTAGHIYTVAGDGTGGFSGDGGPATSAEISAVPGVAVDGAGNLVIADVANNRVRVVAAATGTFYGQAMTAGHIYTIAGNGIKGFSGDGGPAIQAELHTPDGVAVDRTGNLLISDNTNHRVRVIAAAAGTFYGQAMTAGDIHTIAGNGKPSYSGDGGQAVRAQLRGPQGMAVDHAGNLVIADTMNSRVRVVAAATGTFYGQAMTARHIYTVAGDGFQGFSGDGGPATNADLFVPYGVAVDGAGNLLIADTGNNRVRAVAAHTGTFYGQAMTAGHIYTVAGDGTPGFSGDGGPATSAELNGPAAVAVDGAGNLVTDENLRMRVVAAHTGTFYGQAMTAGDIYTVAGNGKLGFSGDGGPATSAELNFAFGVTVDGTGNLLISDSGNGRVRVVAAATGTFYGQAMTAQHIYTVAGGGTGGLGDGGPATSAFLAFPSWVAVDGAGNLVISDSGNNRLRVVAAATGTFYGQAMTAEHIYTVAGDGTDGFSGDGGPATSAALSPVAVAVNGSGDLLVVDTDNSRIREVAP
jgi:hypothetical protein